MADGADEDEATETVPNVDSNRTVSLWSLGQGAGALASVIERRNSNR